MYRSKSFMISCVFDVLSASFILIRDLIQLIAPSLIETSWTFLHVFSRFWNMSCEIPLGKFMTSLLFFKTPFNVAMVILVDFISVNVIIIQFHAKFGL